MKTIKKIIKISAILFLVFCIFSVIYVLLQSPEEMAAWEEEQRIEKIEKEKVKIAKRAEKIESDRIKKEQEDKEAIAQAEERRIKQAAQAKVKAEQKVLQEKKDFKDNLHHYELTARVCAMGKIESVLAPKRAKFPLKEATYDEERDLFRIFSYVDTVNNFNAPVRQNYYCEISGTNLDTSTCKKVECTWQ